MARVYLAEVEAYDPALGGVRTFYLTDGAGYATGPGDTPASVFYEPRLRIPDDDLIGRFAFGDGTTGGASRVEIAPLQVENTDAALDDWVDLGWDGRAFRLYMLEYPDGGDPQAVARSTAVLVLVATMEQALPVLRQDGETVESWLEIRLADPLAQFDKPIQTTKYAGTNVGPTGVEGTADDLKGTPKPIAAGASSNVTARLANASRLIYQVSDGSVGAVTAVYDAGVELLNIGDVATLDALIAASPGSGEYVTCLAIGMFKLGATPSGEVTADIASAATGSVGQAADNDGSGWLSAGSTFNVVPSATGIFSIFARFDTLTGSGNKYIYRAIHEAGPAEFSVRFNGDENLAIVVQGLTGTLSFTSTGAFVSGSTWRNLLISYDTSLAAGSKKLDVYVDDAAVAGTITDSDAAFVPQFSLSTRRHVFAVDGGGSPVDAAATEVYWTTGTYLDLSVEANRRKFLTAGGYPADLGNDGSAPTGASPIDYLRGGPGQIALNKGVGGNFAINGTIASADSTPYEPVATPPTTITAAEIIRSFALNRASLSAAQIDDAAFTAAIAAAPEDVGIWIGDERSIRDVLDDIANSVGLAYWWSLDDKLTIAKLTLPTGSPSIHIGANVDGIDVEPISVERVPTADIGRGIPAHSVVVDWGKNHTIQTAGQIAGSVTVLRRAYLEQEFRQASAADAAVLAKHKNAPEIRYTTLMTQAADAAAFGLNRLAIYKRLRPRYLVRVPLTADTAALDLFDEVLLSLRTFDGTQRFRTGNGLLFRVLGARTNFYRGVVTLDLWGGIPLPMLLPALEATLGDNALRLALLLEAPSLTATLGNLAFLFPPDVRITEAGDRRITEDDDVRITEGA